MSKPNKSEAELIAMARAELKLLRRNHDFRSAQRGRLGVPHQGRRGDYRQTWLSRMRCDDRPGRRSPQQTI